MRANSWKDITSLAFITGFVYATLTKIKIYEFY